ncbi:nodulation protein NfeD [Variovorax robiniae]|uniref:Nodulation protein NfeD n=1 Tax=Variovorax robiniae TaxID=1836199 RepID=A0ABU8X431_9BURK
MTSRRRWLGMLMLLLAAAFQQIPGDAAPADLPPVFLVRIQGGIGPATAAEVNRSLQRAARERAQLVVLEMDTPGGLDTAMRAMVQDILASPVPVAGFVAPSGARAASAGTYLLYACHVAAMAPATNLGAATPVEIGMPGTGGGRAPATPPAGAAPAPPNHDDTMAAKRINDASAYLRSLAQLRGRDVAWAEQAVRESVSLAANDALARKVIDLVAADVPDLLRQLDGRELTPGSPGAAPVKLATAGATVVALEADWRARLLAVISDPSLALILMMIGIYGLLFEFMNPGFIAPGVIGGVALLLALWALQMLPINYAGVGLILLGLAFFAAEAFIPSYGALGLGGVAAFAFGALLLIDSDVPGFGIPLPVIAGLTLVSAAFVIGVARMAVKARARPVRGGLQRLVGATAEVLEFGGGEGWALVDGERWRISATQALRPGQQVRVARAEGLTLQVGPLAATAGGSSTGASAA